ncbi:hypothetical protein RhiTH_010783 [Rhizoctonia solani]
MPDLYERTGESNPAPDFLSGVAAHVASSSERGGEAVEGGFRRQGGEKQGDRGAWQGNQAELQKPCRDQRTHRSAGKDAWRAHRGT